jgi:DNA-binding GntR family transcriptional regulator
MPLAEYRKPVEKQLMRSAAYDVLREAIINGELAPGEAIKDTELAVRLGLSRTPVREALAKLADIGLIEFKPGVHTRVATLDRKDVESTLVVLRVLDELAVRTAVPHLRAADLTAMRRANTRFAKAVRAQDVPAALAADDDFHGVLTRRADNPVLTRQIHQLHPTIHRILYRKFGTLVGGQDTVDHHDRLIEVCAAGDADAAAARSVGHWSRLGGLIGGLFDQGL